jgi:hypothetical protein
MEYTVTVCRHSPTYAVSSYNISVLTQFLKGKKTEITFLRFTPHFFVAVLKAQGDEVGGRILLGEKKGGGAVMLSPIWFQCAGVWIYTGLPGIYIVLYR